MARTKEEYDEMFTFTKDNTLLIKQGKNVVELTADDVSFMGLFLTACIAELSNPNSPYWTIPPHQNN